MQVVLVMFRGGGDQRSFSITRDVTVIGRREDCDFRIPLSEISRKHCRLIKDGESLRVEDLGSSNGTHVNGTRVQEAELSPGDTLKVGSVVFIVQIDGVPADDQLNQMEPAPAAVDADDLTQIAEDEPLESLELAEAGEIGSGEIGSGEVALDSEPLAEVGEEAMELEEVPAEDVPPIADAAAEGEYDPMAILTGDPESSSLGSAIDDSGISEDLINELESQDHDKNA